mgnify:CR=1 FL=1
MSKPFPAEALITYDTSVQAEWIDYNGHMSEAFYVLVFGYATDGLYDLLGIDAAYREAHQCSVYTVEAHINYLQEVGEGEPLLVKTQLLESGAKKMRYFHTLYHGKTGEELASTELLVLFVDMTTHRTAPFPEGIADNVEALRQAHAALSTPALAERKVGQR